MDEKRMLAIMYDFYNMHVLRGQNKDINYYINQLDKYNAKSALVVGAGTGRVAIPLSKYIHVTALDLDKSRLELLKEKCDPINTICVNFIYYKSNETFDIIIIPYSTLQFLEIDDKVNLFFKSLYNIMQDGTVAIIDVSESFNTKPEKDRHLVFKDYCSEVDDIVEVYYSSKRSEKYIEFFVEYKLCKKNVSFLEHEKYGYYDREALVKIINDNGLEVLRIDDGYGDGEFTHKHLYHIKKKD